MGKLLEVRKGRQDRPMKIVLYGVEGVGKSSWAAKAPRPIFIPTEDGLGEIDCESFPLATSYDDIVESLTELAKGEHEYRTVVLDSADWAEPLLIDSVCKDYGVKSIYQAAGGFNRGFDMLAKKWMNILNAFTYLRDNRGMNVIVIAHSKVKTFNDPENPAYDKYSLRLHDKSCDLLMQWADAVLFATRKMIVTKSEDGKNQVKAVGRSGGDRVLRCEPGPACAAKNRYNLPDELPLEWDAFEKAVNENRGVD